MRTDDLRKRFLDFFERNSHKIIASDTLVPDDVTVFFTTAGMQQFKPYFLGEKRDLKRAASAQKCLRTDDLEKVGQTPFHHTFFEMLGNFSFGDYFKRGAIEFAWDFLTKDLNIKEVQLWVSVYTEDREAFKIWNEHIGIAQNRIVKLGEDKNFWPANAKTVGPDGPCGPCSEVFFDKGKDHGCKRSDCNPRCECGRFVEIWNLVFTQFNRIGKNKLEQLTQKNIDTGMGLERMASVLQGKESNFVIDILEPIVSYLEKFLGVKSSTAPKTSSLIYAMVDHIRAATFAISDGVFPSNEERGYVVRKLIRTALWKGTILGAKKPYLYKLPPLYAEVMKVPYPEIYEKCENIAKIIFAEEEKFLSTLEGGKKQLGLIIEQYKKEKKNTISAEQLFHLYDTRGFPLELSEEIIREHKMKADREGFDELLKKQQELSRKKSMFDESIFTKKKFDLKKVSKFIGYDCEECAVKILGLYLAKITKESLREKENGYLILNETPFYPASGGQLCDQGWIKTKKGEFFVEEAFKAGETIVHKGRVIKGEITKGKALASIDKERRKGMMRAHTATHLLQAALREVLGEHVVQQGSLVDVDRLHFDFTHFSRLSGEELEKVESLVKDFIKRKDPIDCAYLSLKEAKKRGALAFFKDKYQDKVRMVSVSNYSKELCAGTHLKNTAEVGDFVIISESSISSGIRRIEALVAKAAKDAVSLKEKRHKIKESVKQASQKEKKDMQARINTAIANQEEELIAKNTGEIIGLERIKEINFLSRIYRSDLTAKSEQSQVALKLLDKIKKNLDSLFVFIVITVCAKDIFICSASDDLIKKGISCQKFVTTFGEDLSLKGGGRDNLVQGVVLKKGDDFLEKVKECFRKYVGAK